MDIEEKIAAVQAESDAYKDVPIPEDTPGVRFNRSRTVVQSVRLPEDEFTEITAIADRANVPVSALIRGWVLRALADERNTSLRDAVDRLVADANRVRRMAEREAG